MIFYMEDNLVNNNFSEEKWYDRTRLMLGDEAYRRLADSHVAVVGVGGVGGYASEMLVRSGVGEITIIDSDVVSVTNINRQLVATHSQIGQSKVDLFKNRFYDINPSIKVNAYNVYLQAENLSLLINDSVDFVIDAIDTVAPKVALIEYCLEHDIKIISSMGAGGRMDPTLIRFSDIWATRDDGLAKAVRQRLKKHNCRKSLEVVCSLERPMSHSLIELNEANKRSSFGTTATIPSIFGIYLANHVIKNLIEI